MAFLVLLERLTPDERAAFLLREVFDCDYGEMGQVLERSEAACRQLVHRARTRVRQAEPRFAVAPEIKERLIERLLAALSAGDRDGLLELLAEEASWTADGGGKVPSTRRVFRGADRVARFLLGVEHKWMDVATHRIAWLNGEPAIVTEVGGRVFAITAIETDGERIVAFYRILNPDKLRHVGGQPPAGSVADSPARP
jgi:RNA polymerase sigma-70 factor (ECF subfamily)